MEAMKMLHMAHVTAQELDEQHEHGQGGPVVL